MTAPLRVAMWSGPRSISTALMRSFGARAHTLVVDEPFYGWYLSRTGLDHPGAAEVIASQPSRWQDVVAGLQAPLPPAVALQYQKQMAQHLLPEVGRDWLAGVRHAFLIRDPALVAASYARVRAEPTLDDLGYRQQVEIFRAHGGPVVDAADVLRDPPGVLARLCAALGIDFQPAMLRWAPGRRDTDGVWAPHWYAAVEASTGFAAPDTHPAVVPPTLADLVEAAAPYYAELSAARL